MTTVRFVILCALVASMAAASCGPAPDQQPLVIPTSTMPAPSTDTPLPPTLTAPPATPTTAVKTAAVPTEAVEPSWEDFSSADFEALHSPVDDAANEHLIFGAIPIATAALIYLLIWRPSLAGGRVMITARPLKKTTRACWSFKILRRRAAERTCGERPIFNTRSGSRTFTSKSCRERCL